MRTPPPQPELVRVDEIGGLSLRQGPGADWAAFDAWNRSACEHGYPGVIVWHRLGNIARISFLRYQLTEHENQFPVLLQKVLYNGMHAGDFLTLADVERVAAELDALKQMHAPEADDEPILREFETQMRELVEASRRVGKPIAF